MGAQIDDITFYDNLKPDLARIMDRSGIAFAEFLKISQKSGCPLFRNAYLLRPMLTACKAANIEPRASFHILRHTYGSSLAMNRVPLQVIAAALGHADTRITDAPLCAPVTVLRCRSNSRQSSETRDRYRKHSTTQSRAQSNEGVTQSGDVIQRDGSFDEKWRLALELCNSCA